MKWRGIMGLKLKHITMGAAALIGLSYGAPVIASVIDKPFFQAVGTVIVWGSNNFSEAGGSAPIVSDFILLDDVASGTEGTDLIANNVGTVATGSLTPLSANAPTLQDGTSTFSNDFISGQTSGGVFGDASPTGLLSVDDTLTAFGIDSATDVGSQGNLHQASFYIASNTAFDIHGQLFNPIATGDFLINFTLDNITYNMDVTVSGDDGLAFGSAAHDPSLGGIGPIPEITTLGDFRGGAQIEVYDGGRQTAASTGSIADQSVRFDVSYALDGDTDAEGVQPFDLSFGNGTISMFMVYTVFAP